MSLYDTALGMCQIFLSGEQDSSDHALTRDQISSCVDKVICISTFKDVDREKLIKELEELFTIWSDDLRVLGNDDNHKPWLDVNRKENWHFWNRYKSFLTQSQRFSPTAVENVEKVTDEVLGRIEDPLRDGPWDRRGLVMGDVQAGKTGTYTGLICKAVDSGYKVIIVLAGLHNNLRSQTQIRLDEGFLGYKAVPPSDGGFGFEPTGVYKFGTSIETY